MEDEEEDEPFELQKLPKDIIFDIFSRIPFKNLCQMSCVCKDWLLLLNVNREFTSFYNTKHKTSPLLMFTKQNNENPSTQIVYNSIDGAQHLRFSSILARNNPSSTLTSNGIVCMVFESSVSMHDPVSKRVSSLPGTCHMSSSISFAMGHVKSSFRNVYKLVHFYTVEKFDSFHYCKKKKIMCEVLTKPGFEPRSNEPIEWRSLGKCPYNILGRKDYACVGRKIYWFIGENKSNFDDHIKIMSFHLENEMFGVVFFPRTCSNRSIECLDLVEIRDRLCLTDRLPWESSIDIWMMVRDDGYGANNWFKRYKIDLMGINHHDVRIMGYLSKVNDGNGDYKDEILIKFGSQSCGVYQLDHGLFRDLGCGVNFDGWDFKLLVHRKHLL